MSWSIGGKITTVEGGPTKVEFPAGGHQTSHAEAESKAAIEAAKKTAQQICESGVVGQGEFSVTLYGHSNPQCKPADGWAKDSMTIKIDQR